MPLSKQKTSGRDICLFDLDGTLASTSKDLCNALNRMLRRRGMPEVSEEACRPAISKGGRGLMSLGFGIPVVPQGANQEMDALFDEFIDIYEQDLCVHSYLFAGVRDELVRLREDGVALGVVTNKREATARRLLETLEAMDFFEILIGGDTLEERKPHPLPMQHAIEALGGKLSSAVMVGDSRADIEGARNAGIASIVVTFGYSDVAVESLGADVVLHDYGDLPQALERLGLCVGRLVG